MPGPVELREGAPVAARIGVRLQHGEPEQVAPGQLELALGEHEQGQPGVAAGVLVELAEDAEVQQRQAAVGRDVEVAGVRVRVEEAEHQDLLEDAGDGCPHERAAIDAVGVEGHGVVDREARHEVHHQQIARLVVDARDHHVRPLDEVRAQPGGDGALGAKIQLAPGVDDELAHRRERPVGPHRGQVPLQPGGQPDQDLEVALEDRVDARPLHLDGHVRAVGQGGEVHLRDAGRGQRSGVEADEGRLERAAQGRLHHRAHLGEGQRRHVALQRVERRTERLGHEIRPDAEDLAGFDEGRAELDEGVFDGVGPRPLGRHARHPARPPRRPQHQPVLGALAQVRPHERVPEAVAPDDGQNLGHADGVGAAGPGAAAHGRAPRVHLDWAGLRHMCTLLVLVAPLRL
ncbi:hypothetical protein D3C72_1157600 [compost metagenome]